jgi:putative phosphoesterase
VGVVADIHANLPALIAALRALDRIGVEAVYGGGDLVGYGAHPVGVCRLFQARSIATVYGDHDYAVGRDLVACGSTLASPAERELARRSLAWTRAHSDVRVREFLRALPFDLRFMLGERRIRVVHGSPRRADEYLSESQPAVAFERVATEADCDVLVFGGTHKPWIHEHAGMLFVSCGSIGRPDDGDPRAAFALLEARQDGAVQASIQRVAFDGGAADDRVALAGNGYTRSLPS